MRFKEVLSRITGFSVPVFGVSWNPPEPQIAVARRVIAFLEDRRVLFVPSEVEIPEHCLRSIVEIRQYLTHELQSLSDNDDIENSLRAMRAACRKFMDSVGSREEIIRYGVSQGHFASWEFISAIGELRGVFGVHIASIAASYGLDIEDDLASILPAEPDKNSSDPRKFVK